MNDEKVNFKPVRSTRTFEEISNQIKQYILKGILVPGDKLPSETDLAAEFQVGRQSIREALRYLELSGFISIRKGKNGGPIIVDTVLNRICDSFVDAAIIKKISINEITTARIEIEGTIVKAFIKNSTEKDLQKLDQNVKDAKKKIKNGVQAFSENIAFHQLLAMGSKNMVFVIVSDAIMAVVVDWLSQSRPNLNASKEVIADHEKLLAAIINKDTKKAISILKDHLQKVKYFAKS